VVDRDRQGRQDPLDVIADCFLYFEGWSAECESRDGEDED
jgi:hypothetical protein